MGIDLTNAYQQVMVACRRCKNKFYHRPEEIAARTYVWGDYQCGSCDEMETRDFADLKARVEELEARERTREALNVHAPIVPADGADESGTVADSGEHSGGDESLPDTASGSEGDHIDGADAGKPDDEERHAEGVDEHGEHGAPAE